MQLQSGKAFTNEPFQRGATAKIFFEAVKQGNLELLETMLNKDRFIVYEFDHVGETALHWAAKRNMPHVIKLLFKYGAFANQKDLGGRTPLFLATKHGNLKAVKALLLHKAKPGVATHSGLNSLHVCDDDMIEDFLIKAELLHICMPLIRKDRRAIVWEVEGARYFTCPDHVSVHDVYFY